MIRRITDEPIPPILYKYRDWTNKFHRNLITHQEIYLPKPSEFNDPFDGNIPIRWDLMTYEECYELNLAFINILNKDKDQKKAREHAKKVTDEKSLWHPEKLKKESPEQIREWDTIIGLYSLSKVNDNILMWSHYSLNHTGFVVGFNTESLINDYDFEHLEPVNYQEEYPTIKGTDNHSEQFHKKFFHKSLLWDYEKEWRLSKNHIKKRLIKIKKETINQIIIGCCADGKQTDDIKRKTRKYLLPSTKIFKAEKGEDKFEITINEIK